MLEIKQNQIIGAGVVCPYLTMETQRDAAQNGLSEAEGLARAVNLDVRYTQLLPLRQIKPATFFSRTFLENLKPLLAEKEISLLVVNATLTPIQQHHLETMLNLKVIDRTALILEIFGERAQTREGKLQVELAHLTYQRSRLVRSWTHLERQRGGAGFLGGPGEKQIELDRRLIDEKIVKIKKDLEKVKNTRALQRGNRRKVPYPVAVLVGYTNAGKSTLFNRLANTAVLAKDMLFATLDPTLRKIKLPSGREIILSDTVGFISNLPHELVMAFRSTLEEVLEADIIVHVRDAASEQGPQQRQDVLQVLEHLGLKNIENDSKYIEVLNKTDLLDEESKNILNHQLVNRKQTTIFISALDGQGCQNLLQILDDKLSDAAKIYALEIDAGNGRLQAWLHTHTELLKQETVEDKIKYTLKISEVDRQKLKRIFQVNLE